MTITKDGYSYGTVTIEAGACFARANGQHGSVRFETALEARNFVLRKGDARLWAARAALAAAR